ncbi:hypothetical protein I7I50_04620 [Histoplasma capsulatum G186AR]|uniref:Uncharacterized protein n=1 Tax=Ajellomyces capsulatus TaxID=5037 RepID=A0A8H7YPU3_AJECA|nr:hypothetical protein I7I52_05529 [Histoplasma capsulatum]QSS75475.1 hypothetical protein I7I50_04620 [Histoplasma capsulatum G186AR]
MRRSRCIQASTRNSSTLADILSGRISKIRRSSPESQGDSFKGILLYDLTWGGVDLKTYRIPGRLRQVIFYCSSGQLYELYLPLAEKFIPLGH